MRVLKWIGLAIAVVGLVATAFTAFGSSSYTFTTNVSSTTSCGSLVFPENTDDVNCDQIRSDNVPFLVAAVMVTFVGATMFLAGRKLSGRRSSDPEGVEASPHPV